MGIVLVETLQVVINLQFQILYFVCQLFSFLSAEVVDISHLYVCMI